MEEIGPFVESLKACPKTGLHNPFKNKERYLMLAEVSRKTVECLYDKEVWNFFRKLIIRAGPKTVMQADGELEIITAFLKNFSGDNVRFLAHSERYPGDHVGQFSTSYRWPYGPVGIITPFNYGLEVPTLQMMGALYMGNKVLVKPTEKTAFPVE